MTTRRVPRPPLWPFLLGDILLLGLAGFFVWGTVGPMRGSHLAVLFMCVGTGALLSIIPFLLEHRAAVRLLESEGLSSAVSTIEDLGQVQQKIAGATGQWETIQQVAGKTVSEAKEIAERMRVESQEFLKFLEKADQTEKAHLRLEIDKLRRSEGEWLQVLVHIYDHIFALHQAALRSKNSGVAAQMDQFHQACRQAGRRVGIVSYTPAAGEAFDEKVHQVLDGEGRPVAGARVAQTMAAGFTYQGQLLRRALVAVTNGGNAAAGPGGGIEAAVPSAPEAGAAPGGGSGGIDTVAQEQLSLG